MSGKNYPCKFHHVYKQSGGCKRSAEECYQSHSDEPGDGPCAEPYCVANGKQFTHMAKNHGKKPVTAPTPTPAPAPVQDPKTVILEKIYAKLSTKLAGKITGMFAEAYTIEELQKILDDESEFKDNIKLACQTIIDN